MAAKPKYDAKMLELLQKSGSNDPREAVDAQYEFAKAITEPFRDAVLYEDTMGGVFSPTTLAPGAQARYQLSLINPGEEADYVAYTVPSHGYIPQKQIESDYVMVPTYKVANGIDWTLDSARESRMDQVEQGLQVMTQGFKKKLNDDAWHTIIAAGTDRNIVVFDGDATAGQFTKRLISLGKVTMKRNGGGNASSLNKFRLTDMWVSPEAIEDVKNWGVDQVDEVTRREYWMTENVDGTFRLPGVTLHEMYELGEGQEYQTWYTTTLGASLGSDLELCIGLDLSKDKSFVMPVREELSIFPDPALHRMGKQGYYGWLQAGFASLDNRQTLLFSL